MCGNFGLLIIGSGNSGSNVDASQRKTQEQQRQGFNGLEPLKLDKMDHALERSVREVGKLRGLRVNKVARRDRADSTDGTAHGAEEIKGNPEECFLLSPLKILETQASSTEIRGGQAGGISCIETTSMSFKTRVNRVRCVARKRHPLASDLAQLYEKEAGAAPDQSSDVTFIGHTRFATASINSVPELHPHEWTPFTDEDVWIVRDGKFVHTRLSVGIHISHNGDFDALEAYGKSIVNSDVGLWLERLLHVHNNLAGDSPKIAGCMDLFRVQGRWGASCRLAFVRILKKANDVCSGEQLSKSAPNTFPGSEYWIAWGNLFHSVWSEHINNIVKFRPDSFYWIDLEAENQLRQSIIERITSLSGLARETLINEKNDLISWSSSDINLFVRAAIRGFLRHDLYSAMTEFLSRAEGSFGVQVHCSLEPGVVVIASKGQPMSLSLDPKLHAPVCLFGSEAAAIAVPIDSSGRWMSKRIDLDSKGEIIRLGRPRLLLEGHFNYGIGQVRNIKGFRPPAENPREMLVPGLCLISGLQVLSYSLVFCKENSATQLINRCTEITGAPIPYSPTADLVGTDLSVTPAIIRAIEKGTAKVYQISSFVALNLRDLYCYFYYCVIPLIPLLIHYLAWLDPESIEYLSGQALAEHLVKCMKHRIASNVDSTDFLIGGIESSLWVAEQFAADLRAIFPHLNVVTVSSNKLLGISSSNSGKVFFPGADTIMRRRIDEHTCVMLISQSGQTFPSLHATRTIANLVGDRLWLLTGCFSSKMELAMKEQYENNHKVYGRNRVFNNYSGLRPAEPSSVAVAATHHTLTRLLLHIIREVRKEMPRARILHPWESGHSAVVIQNFFKKLHQKMHKGGSNKKEPHSRGELGESKHSVYTDHSEEVKGVLDVTLMNLTDGDIDDLHTLTSKNLMKDLIDIVGYDELGNPKPTQLNSDLVKQGQNWAAHVQESWLVLLLVSVYFIVSIGFGITFFVTIGSLIARAIYPSTWRQGTLRFSLLETDKFYSQSVGWTLIGLALQIADAFLFGYLVKIFTFGSRWLGGRPLWARIGKRSLVIVDSPMVHQLLENFVSKLFAQSYSFCSIEVHGASGLDHFVHRFTHRVVRGTLLAVGRPDGRMCTLAKSEAAVILACKQSAFIQNPDYSGPGSGADIVTLGHNPYFPNMGQTCKHIVLPSSHRKRFVDEYIYERLFLATRPFTGGILQNLSKKYKLHGLIDQHRRVRQRHLNELKQLLLDRDLDGIEEIEERQLIMAEAHDRAVMEDLRGIPYGSHHIDPSPRGRELLGDFLLSIPKDLFPTLKKATSERNAVKTDLVNRKKRRTSKDFAAELSNYSNVALDELAVEDDDIDGDEVVLPGCSNDPNVRLAFNSSLDTETQKVESFLCNEQTFYECRIASLERYIAFCVMFHAMAKKCHKPMFRVPWDIARSQSNLRVATTASPVSAVDSGGGHSQHSVSTGVKQLVNAFASKISKCKFNF